MKRHKKILDQFYSQQEVRSCDYPGCAAEGHHKAPKNRELREYYYFCEAHIREYNRAWDYYAGMNENQIESDRSLDYTWRRPTWQFGSLDQNKSKPFVFHNIKDPFGFFHPKPKNHEAAEEEIILSADQREALQVLGLEKVTDSNTIRTTYLELVKRHHPDHHPDDPKADERLKEINKAYSLLKEVG